MCQDIWCVFQSDPVVLDILARREMAVAAIIGTRDMREHVQLGRRQQTVRHCHAQHVSVTLHIQAVLQAQWAEFVFRQFVGKTASNLIAILRDALLDDLMVVLIVTIHDDKPYLCGRSR